MNNRILMLPRGDSLSHVVRLLEIATAMIKLDPQYEITFAGSGRFMIYIHRYGFNVSELPDRLVVGQAEEMQSSLHRCVSAEIDFLGKTKPCCVISDGRMTAGISSRILAIPWVNVDDSYKTRDFFEAQRDIVVKVLGEQGEIDYQKSVEEFFCVFPDNVDRPKDIFELRKAHLNLLTDVPEFVGVRSVRSSYKFVGPIYWRPDIATPEWVNLLDDKRPVVYCSFGSMQMDRLRDTVASQLAQQGCTMVLSGLNPPLLTNHSSTSEVAKRVFWQEYLPLWRMFQYIDVVVCHASQSTIYNALSSGVPIVAYPTNIHQAFSAQLLNQHKVGIGLSSTFPNVVEITRSVNAILEHASYRDACRYWQAELTSWDSATLAAENIIDWLKHIY
jgi:UDP:flavonoid glycosyltransferase YjiC (YdhE family)